MSDNRTTTGSTFDLFLARLSLVTFLALAFSGVVFAAPQDLGASGDIRARDVQKYYDCGSTNTILSLDVDPVPAVAGEDLTVTLTAYTHDSIVENTYAYISVQDSGREIFSKYTALCGEYSGVSCPIEPGSYTFEYTITLPGHHSPDTLTILTRAPASFQSPPLFCFLFSPS